MIKAKQRIISIVLMITLVFSNNIVVFAETTDNETNAVTGETTIDSSECAHEFERCAGTDATCTTEGYIEYACIKCWDESVTYREEIPATGHTWDEDYTIDKEATCTEEGSKSIHCANCDEVKDVTVIEKTGHTYDDGVVTTEPTTTTEGIKTYTCSACGETKEESIPVLESEENACPVASMSIDKKLMSEGETATITLVMNEGYDAKWVYLYKPITKNIVTVYLNETDSGIYTGTFTVDEQTESGIWQVKYLTYTDGVTSYLLLYNNETYTGTTQDTISFSDIEFEVVGTNADVSAPVLMNFSIDKVLVSAGEKVKISITIEEDNPESSLSLCYNSPSGDLETITLYKVSDELIYQGYFEIKEDTEVGSWKPRYLALYDTNDNGDFVYNSKLYSYFSNAIDLSAMNLEVVSAEEEDSTEEQDTYIVIFKDGFGNTLSTQKVAKGDSAIEPSAPTNELYLFSGWDCDFSNITANIIVTATWVLNPDVVYDKEAHIGSGFEIEVYSTSNQTYSITCNEDITFTSTLSGTGIVVTDGQSYYSKTYTITTDIPGSYLFYVEGSRSSNTLTYKVKITDHEWSEEYTIDKKATCIEEGSQSIHCSICDVIQEESEKTIPLGEHAWDEGEITTESTCTEDGEKTYTCATCKNTKTEKIEATGHEWNDDYTVDTEPTCTKNGEKSIHCGICDAIKDETATDVEALGHQWDLGELIIEPTCTEIGEWRYTCYQCNITKSEILEMSDHIWNEEYTIDKEPTCTVDGEKSIYCRDCGNEKENSKVVIPAKGHNYGNWITTKQPTLANEGLKIKTCKTCGNKVSQTIPKLKPEWKHNSKGYWYEYPDGSYPKSCWKKIDGYWYYFDASGYRETGWLKQKNIWYYLNSDGKMATGWKTVGKKTYYFNTSGAMQSGWKKIGSYWYYFGSSSDGSMKTGWLKSGSKWYYLNSDGKMATGWKTVGSKKYYLNSSGAMQSGWLKLSGKWYYLGGANDGSLKTGFYKVSGKTYYSDTETGIMLTGWQKINGAKYYFYSSGVMAAGKWVGDYYLLSNGKMATNQWIGKYYVGADGKWVRGKVK